MEKGRARAGCTPEQIAAGGGCASCCSSILENLGEAPELLVEVFTLDGALERSECLCSTGLASKLCSVKL